MLGASIISLCLLFSGVSMGFGLAVQFLHPFITIWECFAIAAPVGLTLSTWIAVFLKSLVFGSIPGLPPLLGAFACIIQIGITIVTLFQTSKKWSKQDTITAKKQLLFFLPSFIPLILLSVWIGVIHYSHSLYESNGQYHVGGTVYGDLPFHLTIITSILHGNNQYSTPLFSGLKAAFFADSPLVYPWIPDYHAAFLAGSGSTFHFALCYPGICLTTSFFFLMFFFYYRFTKSRVISLLSIFITFFTGGIGGFYWLFYDRTWYGLLAEDHVLMNCLTREIEFYWFSLPAHILFPQRTTQFAYSVSFIVLILIHKSYTSGIYSRQKIFNDNSKSKKKPILIEDKNKNHHYSFGENPRNNFDVLSLFGYSGFVTGLLPLLQVHSFAAIGLVILTIAFIHFIQLSLNFIKIFRTNPTFKVSFILAKGYELNWWLIFGIVSWGVGMPQNMAFFSKVLFPSHPESSQSFLRFMLISNDFPPQTNFILLWLQALGAYVPIYLLCLFLFRKYKIEMQFQIGFFVLFIVSNLVIFQPWVLDNTKVFYIAIFGMSTMVSRFLVYLWNINKSMIINPVHDDNHKKNDENIKSASKQYREFSFLRDSIVLRIIIRIFVILLFISLIFSGFLCTIRETNSFVPMFDLQDIELANWFYENTPIDSRIVVATRGPHFRPSSALGGRTLIASYWGWISNHGMPNFVNQNAAVNNILSGTNGATELLRDYRVNYIVLDWHAIRDYNLNFIHSVAYRVAANGRFIVYEVLPTDQLIPKDCAPLVSNGMSAEHCIATGCSWIPNSPGPWCQIPPIWRGDSPPYLSDCGWESHGCHGVDCGFYNGFNGPYCHLPYGKDNNLGRGAICSLLKANNCPAYNEFQCIDRGCEWNRRSCQYPADDLNKCTSISPHFAAIFGIDFIPSW